MTRRAIAPAFAVALFCGAASAQQTIFNVPSPDILQPGAAYLENDWYARSWAASADDAALTSVRGVAGLGRDVEGGFNIGSFDLLRRDGAFADAAIKWRPATHAGDRFTLGLYGGAHGGIGVNHALRGQSRTLAYAASFIQLPGPGLRLAAGPYFASRSFFGQERAGALVTAEMRLPVSGLTLATDWFTGRGAYATAGLIYGLRSATIYLGYGFANSGRGSDLLTFELGFTHAPSR